MDGWKIYGSLVEGDTGGGSERLGGAKELLVPNGGSTIGSSMKCVEGVSKLVEGG